MDKTRPTNARTIFLAVNHRSNENEHVRRGVDSERSAASIRRLYDAFKIVYPRNTAKSLAARQFVAAIGSAFANPSILWQALSSSATDIPILLYYFGSGQISGNDILLRHGGDDAPGTEPTLSLRSIINHSDWRRYHNRAIVLDIPGLIPDQRVLIDLDTTIIVRSRKDTIRPYPNGANSFSGAFAEAFETLSLAVPIFTLHDLIRLASEKLNSWQSSGVSFYHRSFLSSNDRPLDVIGSAQSTSLVSFASPSSMAWKLDPDNFSSLNEGSREDGIQVILPGKEEGALARSASALLEYFRVLDPSPSVRKAAEEASLSWRHPTNVKAVVPSRTQLEAIMPEWRFVGRGLFWMGSTLTRDADARPEEFPYHQTYLPDFSIAKDPVSIRAWKLFSEGPSETSASGPNCPVTGVSWYEASTFAAWLTKWALMHDLIEPDAVIRLPSEAQWEKAARGVDGRVYPWGHEFDLNRCNCRSTGVNEVMPTGLFPGGDSVYGLHDMSGNVWEWTRSSWGKGGRVPEYGYPYDSTDGREDQTATAEVRRVIRGGAYYYFDDCVRCATRNVMFPKTRHSGGGFRLICELRST